MSRGRLRNTALTPSRQRSSMPTTTQSTSGRNIVQQRVGGGMHMQRGSHQKQQRPFPRQFPPGKISEALELAPSMVPGHPRPVIQALQGQVDIFVGLQLHHGQPALARGWSGHQSWRGPRPRMPAPGNKAPKRRAARPLRLRPAPPTIPASARDATARGRDLAALRHDALRPRCAPGGGRRPRSVRSARAHPRPLQTRSRGCCGASRDGGPCVPWQIPVHGSGRRSRPPK